MQVNSFSITGYQNQGYQSGGGGEGGSAGEVRESEQGAWTYNVGTDADGDGNVDQNLPTMTQDELNAFLASTGYRVEGGVLKSVDGFAMTSAASGIAGGDGDPVLPDVSGPIASPGLVGQSLPQSEDDYAGALAWQALFELARTAQLDQAAGRNLRDALQLGKYEAKKKSIATAEEKIEAEKGAAWVQFAAQMAVAVVSVGGGMYGMKGGGKAILGQGIQGSAQMLGALVTAIDKESGMQALADRKGIEEQDLQLDAERLDDHMQDAQDTYHENRELFKKALEMLDSYVQRQTDAVNNIFK